MSVPVPIYRVEIWSGSIRRHSFGYKGTSPYWETNSVISLKVKPGMTSAIGGFEVIVPDSDNLGVPGKYKDVLPFEDVYIWLDYNATGSALFKGKIDTIKSEWGKDVGAIRRFVGRDYGEALFRILKRRMYTGSASGSVISLKDNAGLTDNTYITNSTTNYPITLENETCFSGIKSISDLDNKDFFMDPDKKLHWFIRQSVSGSETFTTGSNILSHKVTKDVTLTKNMIYVFGMRNPDDTTGSDWPIGHDDWTEADTGSWIGRVISGSGPSGGVATTVVSDSRSGFYATGSAAIYADFDIWSTDSFTVWLRKTLPSTLRVNSGDIIHLYYGTTSPEHITYKLRMETDANNYFETKLEHSGYYWSGVGKLEKTIPLGVQYEGTAVTGSDDTNTGSYKWERVGSPDWYNINYVMLRSEFDGSNGGTCSDLYIDGLYFGTRFQAYTGSVWSTGSYGKRPYVVINERLNSKEYCTNEGATLLAKLSGSITQISMTVTGSEELQVGSRYSVSIPAEGISGYYELIDLEHRFNASEGFVSKCLFSDKKEIRTPIPIIDYSIYEAEKDRSMGELLRWIAKNIAPIVPYLP